MRLSFQVNYVLIRTCDGPEADIGWVGWCPELDVMSQGKGPVDALWMAREASRIRIENDLRLCRHPLRNKLPIAELHDDPDYPFYEKFVNRYMDEDYDERWDRCYSQNNLPAHADKIGVPDRFDIDTNAGCTLISDGWYGEMWYKSQGKRDVIAIVEMNCRVPVDETDVPGYVERNYCYKVVGIKE